MKTAVSVGIVLKHIVLEFYGSIRPPEFSVAHHHLSTWDLLKIQAALIMRDVTAELQPESVVKRPLKERKLCGGWFE